MKRKSTTKSQLLAAKRAAVALNRVVSCVRSVLAAGNQLSNIAYNLHQRDYIPQDDAACMERCYKQWDKASSELNAILRS